MSRKIILIAGAILAFAMIVRTFSFTPELVGFSGPTMGTTYTVKFYTNENMDSAWQYKNDVDAVLARINELMSTYDPESELSRFNQSPINTEMQISSDLAYVIDQAVMISKMSNGEYDVTVGPLVNLWGFGPGKKTDTLPSDEKIVSAQQKVDFSAIDLNGQTLSKTKDIYIDLSSIAKGYGVDKVAKKLEQLGIESYLIEVGGEIVSKGLKPDGGPWRVAIESPNGGHSVVQKVVELADVAIATSGDYRNYFERNGVRYSHTINPKTGKPITHRLVSVTVIEKNATLADGFATAITVLGPDKGLVFAQDNGLAVYMLVKEDLGFVEFYSSAFEPYLNAQ
ncbi:FAD:protein FMN transferase ApbE [Marinomonas sp. 42_23_T18]|nr:FAD:protein FMN transferase ApbE [Marinomonas sp. 42_23_T18]